MTAFFDANVLVYTVADDPRKATADRLLARGGLISAQVLNEFASVAHSKLRKGWAESNSPSSDFASSLTPSFR